VKDTIRPLTSLRFAAAMLVFFSHCSPTKSTALFFATGYAGVGFFFLLSGFILVYTYHEYFRSSVVKDRILAFYRARFARIYPVYVVSILLALVVLTTFGGPNWSGVALPVRFVAFVTQSFAVQSWFPDSNVHFGLNGPAWSISDEAFFYALFPFVAWLLLSAFRRASAATILGCAGMGWIVLAAVLAHRHAIADDWLFYLPAPRLFDFAGGMLLGIAFMRAGKGAADSERWTVREITALLLAALAIGISPILPASLRFSAGFMPFFGAVIYLFAFQQGALSRALSAPLFVRLGEISFAFYMIHATVLIAYEAVAGSTHPVADFVIPFSVTITLSYALYRFVEQPMRAYIRFGAKAPSHGLPLPGQTPSPGFQATPAP
jgi:peptidoglycan/LPS O-acetylase OafA/YrhL